ncbi:hypothetical protein [Hyalangium rubrum]|uniref:Uncharacterized protein n=1 Tax=Hyalangium rubrum TaxID=3103134 RepID=A0ABU5HID8_9BACT|nr:hypothetical protein [Hyalangium sp. s54d21]MDY7231850.1 hypothetical protein [Hyalangium sp. s54d21]
MLTLLLSLLLHLVQIEGLPEGFPGQDDQPGYVKPTSSMAPTYFELLEQNSHILYPALGILTAVLLVAGILQAWRSQDMDGLTKNEFKRAIVNELRRNLSGLPGDVLARAVGLDRLKTMKLLEQMQQEGMINSYMSSNNMQMYRVRGAGPEDKRDKRY